MKLDIKSIDLDITPALEAYINEKLSKLDKYDTEIQRTSLTLSVDDSRNEHTAAATVLTDRSVFRATATSGDMYASIDDLESKLSKQLRRNREKIKAKAMRSRPDTPIEPASEPTKPDPLCLDKPTFIDDAITHLESGEYPFVVFQNAQSKKLTILYESQAGTYSIIEPTLS